MKISIIITNFNYGKFIERCIRSCINQNYSSGLRNLNKDYEIIIVDDCSNDEYCGNSYGGAALTVDFGWKPTTWFRFGAVNQFSAAFASEVKPYNSFTATFKFIPSTQTNLFTSLKFQSIYQSMSSPTSNNTVSGQVGVDF